MSSYSGKSPKSISFLPVNVIIVGPRCIVGVMRLEKQNNSHTMSFDGRKMCELGEGNGLRFVFIRLCGNCAKVAQI